MNKIFILSLPRCGTQSTYKFIAKGSPVESHTLKDLSPERFLRKDISYVFHKISKLIDKQDGVFWSAPYCSIYTELKERYPEAKFLLAHRPAQDWASSYTRLLLNYGLDSISSASLEKYDPDFKIKFRNNKIAEEDLINIFILHRKDVLKEFKDAKNFLDFDLYDSNAGTRIAEFLNLKNFENFPHIDNAPFSLVWYNKIVSP